MAHSFSVLCLVLKFINSALILLHLGCLSFLHYGINFWLNWPIHISQYILSKASIHIHVLLCNALMFVGHHLATKVFIGKLPWVRVIIG